MPALKPHETTPGGEGAIKCCAKGCARGAVCSGDGWQLPFCRPCLKFVPRYLFNAICEIAKRPVYDTDAISEAFRLMELAKRRVPKRFSARAAQAVK
jgi:hypothetical protein